jgi:hypothetical protein
MDRVNILMIEISFASFFCFYFINSKLEVSDKKSPDFNDILSTVNSFYRLSLTNVPLGL